MSALSNRRTTWDATESARLHLFGNGAEPDHEALAVHAREGRVLLLAEAIKADGHPGAAAHSIGVPADAGELAEAEALAAAL